MSVHETADRTGFVETIERRRSMAGEQTGRSAKIYGMGDVGTRRLMGLTRRGESDLREYPATGPDKRIIGRVSSHGVQPRHREKIRIERLAAKGGRTALYPKTSLIPTCCVCGLIRDKHEDTMPPER